MFVYCSYILLFTSHVPLINRYKVEFIFNLMFEMIVRFTFCIKGYFCPWLFLPFALIV